MALGGATAQSGAWMVPTAPAAVPATADPVAPLLFGASTPVVAPYVQHNAPGDANASSAGGLQKKVDFTPVAERKSQNAEGAINPGLNPGQFDWEGRGPVAGLLLKGEQLHGHFEDGGQQWMPIQDDYGNAWILLANKDLYNGAEFSTGAVNPFERYPSTGYQRAAVKEWWRINQLQMAQQGWKGWNESCTPDEPWGWHGRYQGDFDLGGAKYYQEHDNQSPLVVKFAEAGGAHDFLFKRSAFPNQFAAEAAEVSSNTVPVNNAFPRFTTFYDGPDDRTLPASQVDALAMMTLDKDGKSVPLSSIPYIEGVSYTMDVPQKYRAAAGADKMRFSLLVNVWTRTAVILDCYAKDADFGKLVTQICVGILEIIAGVILVIIGVGPGVALIVAGVTTIVKAWFDFQAQMDAHQKAVDAALNHGIDASPHIGPGDKRDAKKLLGAPNHGLYLLLGGAAILLLGAHK